ncbi:hypothetical protein C5C56_15945 [Rathayibacter sp. AY1D1]|uniref:hypothetical protein n=1 Tax=unclassified Rathayibacter TaxID=2609250 RepID=UPI000CE7BE60|nr:MULTISPECIES: hypothetical protein [unclassified Rathayibacter]PPG56506.1 hypothetical protein C5C57_14680 [Rathayibacter sp. AY1C5]PPG99856.1 hypothetical protein C5C32_10420 [Rathayibacter sp. AY1G9]PPH95806.1 hypothetical protein C5C56_15945 [Rathayibacter sp. AY1D1]
MVEDVTPKRLDAAAPALSVVGVVGALVSGVLGAAGAGLSVLAFGWCIPVYRDFLIFRDNPARDCFSQPEGLFMGWFLLVGLGAALSFVCLIVGARPSWDGRGTRRVAAGLTGFLIVATITTVSAVLTFPINQSA